MQNFNFTPGAHNSDEPQAQTELLTIANRGQTITSTNYFDSSAAADGLFFLSWNAGAGRLLVPDSQRHILKETKSAKYVIVSNGPWIEMGAIPAYELLFEDHSDAPFVLYLPHTSSDRSLPASDKADGFYITIWTRSGLRQRLAARYRKVAAIPCLQEWPVNKR